MTKKDLQKWMLKQIIENNSIPMVTRGGGVGWLSSEEDVVNVLNDDDYLDEVDAPDDEDYEWAMANFRTFLTEEELNEMKIVCMSHDTGYNQENFDMFFCIWD